MTDYKPQPTDLASETKGIFRAWWQGSRRTIWFWLVPFMIVFYVVTSIFGPVTGWFH